MKTVEQRPINVGLLLLAMAILLFCMTWPTMRMGLWLDELCSVNDVTYSTFGDMMKGMWGRMDDLHPPLYYVPLYFCIKWFGLNDLAIRTPPLVVGIITIPVVYWLGKLVHSRRVGLVAAFFATVSPFANYFDCQSRGYSLSAMLMALCLISFIKLADSKSTNKTWAFVFTALTSAAVSYTEYPCIFVFPALGLATIWICLAMRQRPDQAGSAKSTFIRCAAALTVGLLMFAPWLPSMITQSQSMRDLVDLAPRHYWPIIFSTNLMMMYPTPLIITIPLYCIELLVLLVYLFLQRKKFKGFKQLAGSIPAPTIALFCAVVVPSSFIGYVTHWHIGYFRYIYPYTAAGWVLLAMILLWMLGYKRATVVGGIADGAGAGDASAGDAPSADTASADTASADTASADTASADTASADKSHDKRRNLILTGLLTSLTALNILYLCWFDSRPQSGLRTMAQDGESGKYDDSLILIVPDVIGPTIGYYFPEKDWKAHNVKVAGYPRWNDPFTPIKISDLRGLWGPEIVQNAAAEIEKLPSQGFKYLVIAKDSDKQIQSLSTPNVQRWERVKRLMELVNGKYKQVGTELHYPGVTEDVTVYKYRLQP